MRKILSEPMLHFFVVGAVLFALHAVRSPGLDAQENRQIELQVADSDLRWLVETWGRQRQRPPTSEELRGLVASFLEERLLALEARALGLDEDDTIVRRRLAQKLEYLVRDGAHFAEPDETELRQYYDRHAEAFTEAAIVSFDQVYFSPDRREDAAGQARARLADLRAGRVAADEVGDPSLVDAQQRRLDAADVAALFGPEFAEALAAVEAGAWTGPLRSGLGVHLVRVVDRRAAVLRPFAEVRDEVFEAWSSDQARLAYESYFADLEKKYSVSVDEALRRLVEAGNLAPEGTG